MRSSPISGTHITPFEAARGRLPRLVIDNPLLDSELPESLPMEEHVAEVKKLMDIAERELFRAKEKYRKDNTERENAVRRDEHFDHCGDPLGPVAWASDRGNRGTRGPAGRLWRGYPSVLSSGESLRALFRVLAVAACLGRLRALLGLSWLSLACLWVH